MSTAPQSLAERLSCPLIDRAGPFDPYRIREDVPVLQSSIRGKPLIYLDNAATTQKPQIVIDTMEVYYSAGNANVHRGVHHLSQIATDSYEGARTKVRNFMNAAQDREIVFTKGTTESINLVAQCFARPRLGQGDEIVISAMEHHSNIVPWQMVCEQVGARLRVIPMTPQGDLLLDEFGRLLSERTRLVAIVHVSNVLGTVNPVADVIRMAHERGAPVLVDGAQAVPHMTVDVRALDCDFYAFSGHKVYGPTGIGVLYGKASLLEQMPPYQGGGSMIRSVSFDKTTYAEIPTKFEAGTPHIAGGIGLGIAIDYLNQIGLDAAEAYERELTAYAMGQLSQVPNVRLIGESPGKVSAVSFVMENAHPHDVGTILDQDGIAVRAGHHCAQPVMQFYGISATTRASTCFYNTREDIDTLVRGLHRVNEVFA